MQILIFLAVLFVLILVHEWGHFFAAKRTGMRVDEFGIGFPPKLASYQKGETKYSLNALPIGGFVKIYGEDALVEGENPLEVQNPDRHRSFTARPHWAQAVVLVAGVTMNVLFAWLLFVAVFLLGVPTVVDEATATADARLMVTSVVADGPAAEAGVPVGATITGLTTEGASLETFTPSTFKAFTETAEGSVLAVTYTVDGVESMAVITPRTGIVAEAPEQYAIGVALGMVDMTQYGLVSALKEGSVTTITSLGAITTGLHHLLTDAVIGQADFSQVAGPVGIAGMVGDAATIGLTSLLMFTAIISLNLAVINMLPFPALDGGRLILVAVEALWRKPLNPIWVMRLNTVGFGLLLLLMITVTYNDIVRLF